MVGVLLLHMIACAGEQLPPIEGPEVINADDGLRDRLRTALAEKPDHEPRTEHLDASGAPKYLNRLILETSPYLLQHAHNPVGWFPWGEEAFAVAKAENKPVLLSVGYSTCHWCHVMERESFEDEEIAAFINAHFVPIKVDREERPDVDDTYMAAVNLLRGRGGWPMTVVMTPDKQPFFGGTYFPARDGDRNSRRGFFTILKELDERYRSDPDGVVAEAAALSEKLTAASEPQPPGDMPKAEATRRTAILMSREYDETFGGFGRQPKFPRSHQYELLLRVHRRSGDEPPLEMTENSLRQMAAGGMYDHVGGGFHRYSTDERWLVPHFEKMLYDQAQLVQSYVELWQVTGKDEFAQVARETLDYVAREMSSPDGGFYSAQDADSVTPEGHMEEGWFYTWTLAEVEAVVGAERARLVQGAYGMSVEGNFEGRNILFLPRSLEESAEGLGVKPADLRVELAAARSQLYESRLTRPRPIRDDKAIAGWNGLMISAFARAGFALKQPAYVERAHEAATFVWERMRGEDGRLRRTFKDGAARHTGVLDDYAFVVSGFIDVYETVGDPVWLERAIALHAVLDAHFVDAERGGYFATSDDAETLLTRSKPDYDGAEPAGNSLALLNLLRLGEFTQQEAYRDSAERGFAAFSSRLSKSGGSVPKMLTALDWYYDLPFEVIIVGPEGGDPDPLLDVLRHAYLPNHIRSVGMGDEIVAQRALIPLLEGKEVMADQVTAFVCVRGLCEQPTSDPLILAGQLAKTVPLLETADD